MLIALPSEYPQVICGVVGCDNKLIVTNNQSMTSSYCEGCKVKINKEIVKAEKELMVELKNG